MNPPDNPVTHNAAEEPSPRTDPTDVAAYAPVSAADLLSDLRILTAIGGYRNAGYPDERLEELGFLLEGGDPLEDQANRLIDEMPMEVATTVTFEVVLGTGGPDRRLCFECDVSMLEASEFGRFPDPEGFTIRRVYYRYAWADSAEVELRGEEREVAEAFARRVVPELER